MTVDNRYFVDTNVLLSATDKDRAHHAEALAFLDEGMAGRLSLYVNGQVLREYLVVATRPQAANGLEMETADALANLRHFRKCLALLAEDGETASCLAALVDQHALVGKRIHDANIVATMRQTGLRRLKTFNPDDFRPFAHLLLE
ncbi:MAG: type II toxin-antitoxin system VapC family toxin [Opitutales bacterium]|nr:type II toxin-antitoxin system VapC family toxin [Opitutales bacterium]